MADWWLRMWKREPLALVGTAIASVGIVLEIEERLSKARPCEAYNPGLVSELTLEIDRKLSFELGSLNRKRLRRVVISGPGETQRWEDLGRNALAQLTVVPKGKAASVTLRAQRDGSAQEVLVQSTNGEITTCLITDRGDHCFPGSVALMFDRSPEIVLLPDGTHVRGVREPTGKHICWGPSVLLHLKLVDGKLRIRK